MAVAILLVGVGTGFALSIAAWIVSASLLLTVLAYPLGGVLGCLLVGGALFLCRGRHEAAVR
jgi:hypothetical protein